MSLRTSAGDDTTSNSGRDGASNGIDTSKPTAVFTPRKPRPYTVSIALPGSIIANAQTHDLKTHLAGQIARALAVFCVDEIVIFDDGSAQSLKQTRYDDSPHVHHAAHDAETGYTAFSDPSDFLHHVLSYLETPPHLRRALFPYHPNLQTAGSLPSLDMPHHLRADEWSPYREGVTVAAPNEAAPSPSKQQNGAKRGSKTSHHSNSPPLTVTATAGLPNPIHLVLPADNLPIPPNTRVTLKFTAPYTDSPPPAPSTPLQAEAVAPDAPRMEAGYYWGYSVRVAGSLSAVFEESPFDEGYDYCVGTSERGEVVGKLLARARGGSQGADGVPRWGHLLVAFGGQAGLEAALGNDATLKVNGVTDVKGVFDAWVNLVEGQGSRTIRTEEAVWIGMMGLRGLVEVNEERWGHA